MRNWIFKHLTALVLVATLMAQSLAPMHARADDSFSPTEIASALKDFYDHYAGRNTQDSRLQGVDLDRLTRVVARQLITLPANRFNEMVGHIIAIDYMQSPDDRKAIEKLIAAMEAAGAGTVFNTEKAAKQKAAMTVLADTVAVWSVVCISIGLGKAWVAADELSGFEKFATVMKNMPGEMPKSLQSRLAIAGLGLAVGSAHAAIDYLYETRFDPQEALGRVQNQVIQDLALKAAAYRKKLATEQAPRNASQVKELQASKEELLDMEKQVEQFSDDDAEYRGRLSPVSEDISDSKALIEKLISESGLRVSRSAD